ncbi:DUF4835 family protein [Flavobacterium sp.]|uniref:type IX secretion system protein PorD n=1 Tax=Flavobacterium sp. TaxID=239 RepID=UPI00260E9421|nr:DUF4835 family protein [Flavobacterium sp.]
MRSILILVFMFLFANVHAQEFNCKVIVNYDKITNVNAQIFKSLETSLNDFVNKTVWTEKTFKDNEKISCSYFITVNSFENNNFEASIQVQSSRPIYNSSFSSPILNINDKDFNFQYVEFQNLFYNPNSYDSNLVSVIAFYNYMILGFDAESFAIDSGTPYFQSAQEIVSIAAPTGGKGWSQTEKTQNRYFLVNDVMSTTFRPLKEALFQYHFNGMDVMHKDLKTAKEEIVAAINTLSTVHSVRPNAYLTRVFFDAKSDEIVSIFSGGPSVAIDGLVDKLSKISPTNSSKWLKIKF